MPYADPKAQREYQRQWISRRRSEYLAGRSCVLCGSGDALEIDHSNPRLKIDHRIWSWSRPRLEAELAKCIVVCRRCHAERHSLERPKHGAGGYKRGCRCEVCQGWKDQAAARERAKRRDRESNPAERLCRPLRNRSAITPEGAQASDQETAA